MVYEDLPEVLQPLFDPTTLFVPPAVRQSIAQGWLRLSRSEQDGLIKRLRREPDPLNRVMRAVGATVPATLHRPDQEACSLMVKSITQDVAAQVDGNHRVSGLRDLNKDTRSKRERPSL